MTRPDVVFIFADEWRAQAAGYNGDPNCITPVLDRLAGESLDVTQAVAGCPVCCPYRASLMTGQYPTRHGVIINDVELDPGCASLPRAFAAGGYDTAYIGKWHLYGSPDGRYGRRKTPVPRSHQLGFDRWWGFECNHDYTRAPYTIDGDPTVQHWDDYEPFAQSRLAARLLRERRAGDRPLFLSLSWGPPHFPLHTAPEAWRRLYAGRDLALRPNVPPARQEQAREELRGYYAHIAALDHALAMVLEALRDSGRAENTLLVVTADHGDMSWSQGVEHKLLPFDESLRVPFLLRWPARLGRTPRQLPLPLDAPDLMPSLLGLCGLEIPETVQGRDWSRHLLGEVPLAGDEAALLGVAAPFTHLLRYGIGAYRGLRTATHTYVRTEDGPWLLFDNQADPYQMRNLIGRPEASALQAGLEALLQARLAAAGDPFEPGRVWLERLGLGHYREVQWPCTEPWCSPWG